MYWTFTRKSSIIPTRSRCSKKQRQAGSTKGQRLAERRAFLIRAEAEMCYARQEYLHGRKMAVISPELRGNKLTFLVTAFKTSIKNKAPNWSVLYLWSLDGRRSQKRCPIIRRQRWRIFCCQRPYTFIIFKTAEKSSALRTEGGRHARSAGEMPDPDNTDPVRHTTDKGRRGSINTPSKRFTSLVR